MKMEIKLGIGYDRLKKALDRAPQAFQDGIGQALSGILDEVSGDVARDAAQHNRTGTLARSIHAYSDNWRALSGYIGIGNKTGAEKYGFQLTDETKTIVPEGHPYLAIPIGDNLTGAGVARASSPRQILDGFFFTSKKGNLLFGVRGAAGGVEPLFALKESVTVTGFGSLTRIVPASKGKIIRYLKSQAVKALQRLGL